MVFFFASSFLGFLSLLYTIHCSMPREDKENCTAELAEVENSSDDGGGLFGDLFEGDVLPAPEYPIETLQIDRAKLCSEGITWKGFTPLLDRFDNLPPADISSNALEPHSFEVCFRNKHHSLWGHKLWNAAKYLVKRMDQKCIDVAGKTVLELGAGLGVPAISAHLNGASLVVVTDYPDADLLDIIQVNVEKNCRCSSPTISSTENLKNAVKVEQLLWGKQEHIDHVMSYTQGKGFDIIILSDILFNHVCNDNLAETVATMLRQNSSESGTPVAYCVFSHHRAHKQLEDLVFFDKCIAKGLFYELIDREDYPLMFPQDRGPEAVRQPVHVYRITREPPSCSPYSAGHRSLVHPLLSSGFKALSSKETRFDVVIQGASLPQMFLSAALARAGFKVLLCDASGFYGGSYASLPLGSFIDLLRLPSSPFTSSSGEQPVIVIDKLKELEEKYKSSQLSSKSTVLPCLFRHHILVDLLPQTNFTRGEILQLLLDHRLEDMVSFQFVDRIVILLGSDAKQDQPQLLSAFDLPFTRAGFFSSPGSLFSLVEKRRLMLLMKKLDPCLVEGFHASNGPEGDKDESLDDRVAIDPNLHSVCTDDFIRAGQSHLCEGDSKRSASSYHRSLQNQYRLRETAVDVITLFELLCHSPSRVPIMREPGLVQSEEKSGNDGEENSWRRSIALQRQLFTSTGRFNAPTPFLQVEYGVGELSQAMSRVGAVTGNVIFALDRGVQRIVRGGEDEIFAVMSNNGQHVKTKVVVMPDNSEGCVPLRFQDFESVLRTEKARKTGKLGEYDVCVPLKPEDSPMKKPSASVAFARVTVLASRPLCTSSNIPASVNKSDVRDDNLDSFEGSTSAGSPKSKENLNSSSTAPLTLVALCRLPKIESGATDSQIVVHVAQLTSTSGHIPVSMNNSSSSPVLLQFTARGDEISSAALYTSVVQAYFIRKEGFSSSKSLCLDEADILFAAHFTVDEARLTRFGSPITALGDFPSPTLDTDAFCIGELRKLKHAQNQHREMLLHSSPTEEYTEEMDEPQDRATRLQQAKEVTKQHVVTLPVVSSALMDDSAPLIFATKAYEEVLTKLGVSLEDSSMRTFMQPLPNS